ncbi:MAG: flagellar brake protein [Betaproteobacteria bacterium]|nr:flagellar brake protein [Betaproteobacteria bacterium]
MAEDSFLTPVRKNEIEVGRPLPWSVYDADRNLLLRAGVVVVSEHQVDVISEKGLFREMKRERSGHVNARLEDSGPMADERAGAGAAKSREENVDLDALKLLPGDTLQLQPLLEGQTERFNVRVIGVMKPKSVLVTAPTIEGRLIFVKDGQTYLVRVFSGLNVCAFKAKVLKSQLQPFPYLHLSYPESVQAMRIRKAMRAPTSLIVAISETEEGRQTAAGRIVDISVGGAKILSSQNLGLKDDTIWIAFKVKLADMEEYVKIPATLRAVGEEEDEQGKTMKSFGVQFSALGQSQRLIIMNLVYQHLLRESA